MACSPAVESGAAWCFYHREWHFFTKICRYGTICAENVLSLSKN